MILEHSFFQNSMAILPELILISCLLLILIIDLASKEKKNLYQIPLIGLFISMIVIIGQWKQIPTMYFLESIQIDSLSLIFRFFLMLCSVLCITLSIEYIKCSEIALTEFLVFLLGATLGGMFLCSANNLVTVFVALELLSLSCYLLTAYTKKDIRSNEAAMKYLLIGGASSAILAYGFSWLYGISGGKIQLYEIAQEIQNNQLSSSLGVWVAFICITVGTGFKISIAPFHQWTPDVYEGSPTPVVAFLSVGSKTAGLALIIRTLSILFPYLQEEWHILIETLAILSMVLGNLIALTQTSMKRILAYSSISQVGYLMIGLVAGNPDGYASITVYIMLYIFMNLGAFACIIIFGLRTGTDQIRDYTGLYKKDPWLAFCFSIFLLSLGGIPPLAGFFGKIYLFWCGWKAGLYLLVIIGILTSVISIYYYLKIVKLMMVKEDKETSFYVQNYMSSGFSILPKTSIEFSLFLCVLASSLLGIAMNPIIAITKEIISFDNIVLK